MFSPTATATSINAAIAALADIGRVLEPLIWFASALVLAAVVIPQARRFLTPALGVLTAALLAGEGVLIWFHLRLYELCQVFDPASGQMTGSFAVPLWIESEKLYVWALIMAVIALVVKRHKTELQPVLAIATVALAAGALVWGRPFAEPLPNFLTQYGSYLSAWASGDPNAMMAAFQRAEGSRQFFYNTWYMWVHPPLLFVAYGAFVASFAATVLTIVSRRQSFETTAYRWARFGYLPFTVGMLIGFPWAVWAWAGESWWWSAKINMSIMMWLLYTAYLHARLYLRRPGMWRLVALLGVLCFVTLVLTYITTYTIPGAHSVVR